MNSPELNHRMVRHEWWVWATLVLIGLLAFWPSVWFDFVNWDDPAYVWNNDLIKSWSPSSLYGVATETVTRNYAPLTIGTLLIDHTLWGMQPSGYHATNVLLHLVNGILVFILTCQLTRNRFVGWLTAALFLVHPIQIETVAWISSRKGLLSATFILAALIVRLKPVNLATTTDTSPKQDLWYIIWLAAALLSKALAVVVPPIVLLYDVLIARRKISDAMARQFIPGLMSLILLFRTMASQHSVLGGLRGHLDLSLLQILAVDTTLLWKYVGMMIWPANLCVLYDPPTSGIAAAIAVSGAGWVVVAAVVWRLRNRSPALLWSLSCFLLLLLPVLNFFPITTLMNDRYLYLPCILFFAVGATVVHRVLSGSGENEDRPVSTFMGITRWSLSLGLVVAALLATTQHLPVWRNSFTLWNHAMTQVPQLPAVRMQLALTYHDSGQNRQAVGILQQALLECQPDDCDRKRMDDAVEQWLQESRLRTAEAPFRHQ
ncbi:MAG: hypothetical protein MK102_00100 [Fuerstiella sp.]|nr:hypothetical protein [Fuerstiella sp.]